jgi:hypothetical protein
MENWLLDGIPKEKEYRPLLPSPGFKESKNCAKYM